MHSWFSLGYKSSFIPACLSPVQCCPPMVRFSFFFAGIFVYLIRIKFITKACSVEGFAFKIQNTLDKTKLIFYCSKLPNRTPYATPVYKCVISTWKIGMKTIRLLPTRSHIKREKQSYFISVTLTAK